jgi:hypothetical protein
MAPTLKGITGVLLAVGILLWAPLFAGNVYRYVDENGKIHYSATLPPEYANRPHEIINQSGIVIERVDPTAPKPEVKEEKKGPEPLYTEDEVRLRSDRLLVLKYHSEEDVFEAMNLEVANLGYDARILDQAQASLEKSLSEQVKEAADRQRAGMPPDPDTTHRVEALQKRLSDNAESRAALQAREDQIRAVFMAELERYRYLRDGGAPGSIGPDPGTGQ